MLTPNSVHETKRRPQKRLARDEKVIRELAAEEHVPLADCYRAFQEVRKRSPKDWELLVSNDIHPNFNGHKLFAREAARVVTGRDVSLKNAPAASPALPKTLARLKAGQPIRVLAAPPYDRLIAAALKSARPNAGVTVSTWPITGRTITEAEKSAVRPAKTDPAAGPPPRPGKEYDLVILALPDTVETGDWTAFVGGYDQLLSLSTNRRSKPWLRDCLAIPPSVTHPNLPAARREQDRIIQAVIRGHDQQPIIRKRKDKRPAGDLLAEWLKAELKSPD